MTNTNAMEVVTSALKSVSRLVASFELFDNSYDLNTVGTSEQRLSQLVSTECALAERRLTKAMDLVAGNNLTAVGTALDEVRKTRQNYYLPMQGATVQAFACAKAAREAIVQSLRGIYLDDAQTRTA